MEHLANPEFMVNVTILFFTAWPVLVHWVLRREPEVRAPAPRAHKRRPHGERHRKEAAP